MTNANNQNLLPTAHQSDSPTFQVKIHETGAFEKWRVEDLMLFWSKQNLDCSMTTLNIKNPEFEFQIKLDDLLNQLEQDRDLISEIIAVYAKSAPP